MEEMIQREITLTPEEEQRALRRALLPHTVERLERDREKAGEEVKQLAEKLDKANRQIEQLQAPDTDRACALTQIVFAIKAAAGRKRQKLSQAQIALSVDKCLETRNLELKNLCPPGWLKGIGIQKFPRLFSECIKHPTLRGKAKTLITRA